MRKSRFTEEQIIKVLKEHGAGLSAGEPSIERFDERVVRALAKHLVTKNVEPQADAA